MKINYDEKIKKINDDRIIMLNGAKENLSKNNVSFLNNLESVIALLNEEEINTKKYKAILNANQFIFELTEQVVNANNIEEVTILRKKINYYINKIKKELANRNIEQDEMDKIYNGVDYLRTDINKCIRVLKRETNVEKIYSMYENINNLSIDEIKEFKKLLSNESRYNKKFIENINNYTKKSSKKNKKEFFIVEDDSSNKNEDNEQSMIIGEIKEVNAEPITHAYSSPENFILSRLQDSDNLDNQISQYLIQYGFSKLSDYDGNFAKKIIIFFKNMPKYISNKKMIKSAEFDYNVYYHGKDLGDFIKYCKKSNSIQLALEIIFKRSNLSKKEIECLFNHEMCVNWINEFCEEQSNTINNKKLIKG